MTSVNEVYCMYNINNMLTNRFTKIVILGRIEWTAAALSTHRMTVNDQFERKPRHTIFDEISDVAAGRFPNNDMIMRLGIFLILRHMLIHTCKTLVGQKKIIIIIIIRETREDISIGINHLENTATIL